MSSAPAPGQLKLRAAGATHVGRRRKNNEDAYVVRDDLTLYIVADGAGGHNMGEVASDLAVRSISQFFESRDASWSEELDALGLPRGARLLSTAIRQANKEVFQLSHQSNKHQGMGSTVVAVLLSPGSNLLHVAHVGDSRCYRLRGEHLEQLTQDHSLATDVLEERPDLDDAQLSKLPKNVVTRALGIGASLRVSVRTYQVVAGDRYLLCSDGLSGPVPPAGLADCLRRHASPDPAVRALIDEANAAGGRDNIAAVVVHCDSGVPSALPPSAGVPDLAFEDTSTSELFMLEPENVPEPASNASNEVLMAIKRLRPPPPEE